MEPTVETVRPPASNESPYRAYFDEMPAYVCVLDAELRLMETNRQFKARFGGRDGMLCYAVLKGRKEPCIECSVMETFVTGKGRRAEDSYALGNGGEMPVIAYTQPIRGKGGEVERVLMISADVTEVKKLQKRLHETQRFFRELFNEVPCYVSVQDKDLKVVNANRLFKEDFGEDIGCHCYEIYKHRDEPCLVCPV
ncbi:MAG: PAS domain S-box protein, partial [Myxococcales bacterium]